jgi:hypothetical protein
MRHCISSTIQYDKGPTGLISLEVLDGDGVEHIVQFRDPLMLPPPTGPEKPGKAFARGEVNW